MLEAIITAGAIALLSFSGAFFFGERGALSGTHRFILPAAVGVFLGVVFFDLIPETLEASPELGGIAIVGGFLMFFLLSHVLRTYHHHHDHKHDSDDCTNRGGMKLLIGDGIHNFSDGIVLASAFLINPALGFATAVGIALHEIPQEIAELGVLIKSGYSKGRALMLNFFSALSIVVGAVLTYALAASIENITWVLTGVAAGNLLYIAASDLVPELQESHGGHFYKVFLSTVAGIVFMSALIHYSHELLG